MKSTTVAFRVSEEELKALNEIGTILERSQSETLRFLINNFGNYTGVQTEISSLLQKDIKEFNRLLDMLGDWREKYEKRLARRR